VGKVVGADQLAQRARVGSGQNDGARLAFGRVAWEAFAAKVKAVTN
jgi:hypothetical protein